MHLLFIKGIIATLDNKEERIVFLCDNAFAFLLVLIHWVECNNFLASYVTKNVVEYDRPCFIHCSRQAIFKSKQEGLKVVREIYIQNKF